MPRQIRKRLLLVVMLTAVLSVPAVAQSPKTLHIAVTGESNLRSNFIDDFKDASREVGLSVDIVPKSDAAKTYTIIIAQESSMGGAAAAVIALDADADVAASVVRSGRLSDRGAMNACAKELAKKLAVLTK
jgi:hypothetical protein